ncbi:MAG: antibiotic biosynthesis monooxygenase family protein [Pseudomonadota bacterium]|nr:antibiotic biosynthesis monooxygenase family protein [Pseudomonadota bacterium]
MLRTFALALVSILLASCAQKEAEAAATDSAAYLIIVFHVAEDRLSDFLPIMTGVNEGMAGEEGFESAVVYRDVDDPLTFTLVEKWTSRELHRAHYDRIVASGDWANILDMLEETPALRYNQSL